MDGASQSMAYNLNMGQHFRDETRQFIESSLDLDRKQSNYITDNAIICGFSPIADFIREEYDEGMSVRQSELLLRIKRLTLYRT